MSGVVLKDKREIGGIAIGVEGKHGGSLGEGKIISGELEECFGDVLGREGSWFDGSVCVEEGGMIGK